MWVSTRKQQIRRGNSHVWVDVGDPVPEAKDWSPIWMEKGNYVRWVPDEPEKALVHEEPVVVHEEPVVVHELPKRKAPKRKKAKGV